MSAGSPLTPPGAARPGGLERLDAMSTVLARNWWLMALRGVVAILFGLIAFVAPGAFVLSLVLFFAAYSIEFADDCFVQFGGLGVGVGIF